MSPTPPDEPRAVGLIGPSHIVLQDAGVYEEAKRQGMHSEGLNFRNRAVDDGHGGQQLGDILASALFATKVNGEYPVGGHFIFLPQAKLVRIIAEEMKDPAIGKLAEVHLGLTFVAATETADGVTVAGKDAQGTTHEFEGSYLVGADGRRSEVRRGLGLALRGFSWPERLISTDIRRTTNHIPDIPACHHALERVEAGRPGLWRYSMAISDASVPEERLEDPAFVVSMLRKHLDGPRDQDFQLVRFKPYKMHQLLCLAMRKGRAFLAGDAAHINNPIGGLGLNTGILDANALAQTLVAVLRYGRPEPLFDRYSYKRWRIFQLYVDPVSKSNKQRLHDHNPDSVAGEDWFFADMRSDNPVQKLSSLEWMSKWRTDMSAFDR